MKTRLINNELTETFELIGSRMFNLKHCFELFEYNLQNDGYAENPVEIITFFIILKEYLEIWPCSYLFYLYLIYNI